jgi:hypothetical protein
MPSSNEAVASVSFIFPLQLIAVAILAFLSLLIAFSKWTFDTFSLSKAWREYKSNCEVKKKYFRLFDSREGLLYHIGSAKSRGEYDLAKKLLRDLDSLDKVWY